jgi:hypothetical protein
LRGYIVHIPAVDEGGDLWVVNEDSGQTRRVQVKTCASPSTTKWPALIAHQVSIKGSLLQPGQELVFVFHLLHSGAWHTLVIHAQALAAIVPGGVPAANQTKNVWFVFHPDGRVTIGGMGGVSVEQYLGAWDGYFPVVHQTGVVL